MRGEETRNKIIRVERTVAPVVRCDKGFGCKTTDRFIASLTPQQTGASVNVDAILAKVNANLNAQINAQVCSILSRVTGRLGIPPVC